MFVAHGSRMWRPYLVGQRGSVSVEYLLVVIFAGALVVIAVAPVLGPAIVDEYTIRRAILYSSFP